MVKSWFLIAYVLSYGSVTSAHIDEGDCMEARAELRLMHGDLWTAVCVDMGVIEGLPLKRSIAKGY